MKKFLLLTALLSFTLMAFFSVVSRAQLPMGGGTIRYVMAEGGVDCGDCTDPRYPCKTITHALSRSSNGETIRIANKFQQAFYHEQLVIDKSVRLEGGWNATPTAHGLLWRRPDPCEADRTVIDAGSAGRVTTIKDGASVEIDCLVIQNGNATSQSGHGGGIYIDNAHLVLSNAIVQHNIASNQTGGWGGGIFARGPCGTVRL